MPAHLRSIVLHCQWAGCTRRATVRLFNTWNAPCGDFCGTHGDRALKDHKRKHEGGTS